MNILAIDPNIRELANLVDYIEQLFPESRVLPYTDSMLAFQYAFNYQVDAVYSVMNMPRLDGITLIKMLRKHGSRAPVYLIGSGERDGDKARSGGAKEYLMRPLSREAMRACVDLERDA